MALNFNVLAQVPSVGERFAAGRLAAQEEQQRNMLLQQRSQQAQLERENALFTRQKTMADMEAARQRRAAMSRVAEVFRREGKSLDLNTINEAMAWALESGSPDAVKQAEGLRNLFLQQQEDERIFGAPPAVAGAAPPAMAAPQAAMAPSAEMAPEAPGIEPLAPFGFGRPIYQPGEMGPGGAAASAAVAPPVDVRLGGAQFSAPTAQVADDGRVNRAAWMSMAPVDEGAEPVNALAPEPTAPVNALSQQAVAPAVQVAGPAALPAAKTFEYGGRTYTPEQIDMLLRSNRADRRDLGKAIVAANKPVDQRPIAVGGRLVSPEGRVIYEPPAAPAAAERPIIVGGRLVSPTGQVIYEPPPGPVKPSERYVPVGPHIFDRVEGSFLEAPTRVSAPAQPPEARVKPTAPMRVRPGETLVDPNTGQPIYAAPPAPAPAGRAAATAGGTPAQLAKAELQRAAQVKLSQDLQTQLGYYNELSKLGAMTSPGQSVIDNAIAYARASGLGQAAERAAGTRAQTLRDNIANARQRILMHVKNATGASAGQMNSNVELQTWLRSLTDPQQSIETVRETLTQMDAVIGSVRDQVARESSGGASAAPAAPAPAAAPAAAAPRRREIAPGVFVTERP